MSLEGKRVVVLGGTSGIGFATAKLAWREGASVVVASSQPARVERALGQLKREPGADTTGAGKSAQASASLEGHAVDLTAEGPMKSLFEKIGAFDHLVFTAGEALQIGSLASTDLAVAQTFFKLRFWGAFLAARHGAPHLRAGGSIVFTSGLAGARPQPGWSLGASICSAMEGLTRALAIELAPIRVNIVSPGLVKTPLWSDTPEAQVDALFHDAAARLPVRHVGEADEVAQTYLYAMQQTYATGQTLRVDGGGGLA